jgi:crotonobetainyl-CoA:carnitine CoA-transferase CaiB-like acyl-CoA transferase
MTGIECPIKIKGAKEGPHFAPPTLGQDTTQVLKEILGYSEDQIKKLKEEEEAASAAIKNRSRAVF